MKITNRKFQQEDFKDQKWIGALLSPLNTFISEIYSAFQNRLSVADNLYQEIKTLSLVNETSNFPVNFKTKFNKNPEGLTLIYCKASDGTLPSAQPLIDWGFNDGILTITSISNLTASKKYTIKLHLFYE